MVVFAILTFTCALLALTWQVGRLDHKVKKLLSQTEEPPRIPGWRGIPYIEADTSDLDRAFGQEVAAHSQKPPTTDTPPDNAVRPPDRWQAIVKSLPWLADPDPTDGWHCPKCGATSKSECPEQPEFNQG